MSRYSLFQLLCEAKTKTHFWLFHLYQGLFNERHSLSQSCYKKTEASSRFIIQ